MAFSIRAATPADVEAIEMLLAQLGYPTGAGEMHGRVEGLLMDPRAGVLIAADDDLVLGLATIYHVPVAHEAGPWCRLTALVVDESHRGYGIGQALVAAAERAARSAGCSRMEATSGIERTGAHRFYERLGYSCEAAHFLKRLTPRDATPPRALLAECRPPPSALEQPAAPGARPDAISRRSSRPS
jgi:predicted N-acetyltransferase YhbS